MPVHVRLSEKAWGKYWQKNKRTEPIVFKCWESYRAEQLRCEIRVQTYGYNSAEYYWNMFCLNRCPIFVREPDLPDGKYPSVCALKKYKPHVEGQKWEGPIRRRGSPWSGLEIVLPSSLPPKLHNIPYNYYEIDKELSSDRYRYTNLSRNVPKNILKFIEPYSYKFYHHVSNPGTYNFEICNAKARCESLPPNHVTYPYASVFSASNGMDVFVTYAQNALIDKSVPYRIRQRYFKPATNTLINHFQLIEVQRKSVESLNECLYLAHERNINAMVRYSLINDPPGVTSSFPLPLLQPCFYWDSSRIFNTASTFLDLSHAYPVSSEIFYANPVLSLIKRRKFLLRTLVTSPHAPRCRYCKTVASCMQCYPVCSNCDFHYSPCRHNFNIQWLRREKNQPLSLMHLSAMTCRRYVSLEKNKAYPCKEDMRSSSIVGHCPIYQSDAVTFQPTPKSLMDFIEFFSFEQPDWPHLLTRFRAETNIELIENSERKSFLLTQQKHSMLFELRCPNRRKSEMILNERCSYLNMPMNVRVVCTSWNIVHRNGANMDSSNGMFLDTKRRELAIDSKLVPKWLFSDLPTPGLYHTNQMVGRYARFPRPWDQSQPFETRDQWFSLYGRDIQMNGDENELCQKKNGEWESCLPPRIVLDPVSYPPSHTSRRRRRVPSDRESDSPSPPSPQSLNWPAVNAFSDYSPIPTPPRPPIESSINDSSSSELSDSVFDEDSW